MKQTEFAKVMGSLVGRGEPFALATVVKTEGSSLGKPGFKLIMSSAGEALYGSLGGACPDSAIASAARSTLRTGSPKVVKVFLENVEDSVGAVLKSQNEDEIHVETNCGGSMEIYIEPYLPQQRLVLIGQGGKDDVEDALVKLGKILDFEVVVVDHSPVLSEQPDRLIKDVDYDPGDFDFSGSDSVVVLTKGERDISTLQALSKSKLRYVGMLASHKRAEENASKLRKLGVNEDFIRSLRSPVGVDLGAVTAAEIALSIMAEVVAGKYSRDVVRKAQAEGTRPSHPEGRAR
jgi:xanthine dehydrogenase accessory factor